MFLIPYVRKSGLSLVFLSDGGKCMWETEEILSSAQEYVQEYFEPNGLRGSLQPCSREDVILFEVDMTTTRMEEFYSMVDESVPTGADVWRPFFWIEGADPERQQMSLGTFGTAADLGELIRGGG